MIRMMIVVLSLLICQTAFAEDIHGIIKYLYPEARFQYPEDRDNPNNYELRDESDGNGVYIAFWNLNKPEPSISYLRSKSIEYETFKADGEAEFKARKDALIEKLGIRDTDIEALKGLVR